MNAHLEVLAAVLVLVGTTDDREAVLLGGKRNRTTQGGLRTLDRLDDLLRRLIDDLVVERLQADTNTLGPGSDFPVRIGRHLMILVTRPAPTVRPPSRIANRWPSSIAIGVISSTDISVLSPGITISVPAGNVTLPVTSVVRK